MQDNMTITANDQPKAPAAKLSIPSLTLEDVEALGNDAIRDALQSVLRKDQVTQLHKDHGSHSNAHV